MTLRIDEIPNEKKNCCRIVSDHIVYKRLASKNGRFAHARSPARITQRTAKQIIKSKAYTIVHSFIKKEKREVVGV